MREISIDRLKLAWKFIIFYDLNTQTLRRLVLQYGLQEYGGFPCPAASGSFSQKSDHLSVVVGEERDPLVRRCLTHQALLNQQVLALRARGMSARVRGWLIEIEGGKARRPQGLSLIHSSTRRSHPG